MRAYLHWSVVPSSYTGANILSTISSMETEKLLEMQQKMDQLNTENSDGMLSLTCVDDTVIQGILTTVLQKVSNKKRKADVLD